MARLSILNAGRMDGGGSALIVTPVLQHGGSALYECLCPDDCDNHTKNCVDDEFGPDAHIRVLLLCASELDNGGVLPDKCPDVDERLGCSNGIRSSGSPLWRKA